jgi:hypothetical protein
VDTVSTHFQAKIVKRSEGKNVVAAAAYRAGTALTDDTTGKVFDYSRRQVVGAVTIMAPEGAPEWVLDRGQLWNRVETNERRKDSQLAREIEISLPASLSAEARQELVWNFCREHFVAAGMVADIALHGPGRGDQRNHHAHVLLTTRTLDLRLGHFTDKAREWNANEVLEGWKQAWESACNDALAKARANVRVDRRSLAQRREALLDAAEKAADWIDRRRFEIEAERLNYTPRPHLPQTPYRAMVAGDPIPPKWAEAVKAWKEATASRAAAQARAEEMERLLEEEITAEKEHDAEVQRERAAQAAAEQAQLRDEALAALFPQARNGDDASAIAIAILAAASDRDPIVEEALDTFGLAGESDPRKVRAAIRSAPLNDQRTAQDILIGNTVFEFVSSLAYRVSDSIGRRMSRSEIMKGLPEVVRKTISQAITAVAKALAMERGRPPEPTPEPPPKASGNSGQAVRPPSPKSHNFGM